MGNCSYVNQEKSGPSKGWYCNKAGAYVESSYWRNYCSGSTSSSHCPYLGGDDKFRNPGGGEKEERQSQNTGNTYSSQPKYDKSSVEHDYDYRHSGGYAEDGYTGGYTGRSSSGGGGGGFLGIFDIFQELLDLLFKLVTGGGLIIIAVVIVIFLLWNGIRFLGAQIGVIKSPLTISLSLPEDSSIQAEDISFQLIGGSGTGKAVEAALDEEGTCSVNVKKGTYEFVQKYDGLSICLGVGTVDGTSEYDLAADTHLLENWVVRFTFCDEGGTADISGNTLNYTAVITEGDWKVASSCCGCVTVVNNLRVEEEGELIYMGQTLPLQEEQESGVLDGLVEGIKGLFK